MATKKNHTSKTPVDLFRTPYTFDKDDPRNFSKQDPDSDVQLDSSIGIRELFARHARGLGGAVYNEGTYEGEDVEPEDYSRINDPGYDVFDAHADASRLSDIGSRVRSHIALQQARDKDIPKEPTAPTNPTDVEES